MSMNYEDLLIKDTNQAIVIFCDKRIISINSAFERIFKIGKNDEILNIDQFFGCDELDRLRAYINAQINDIDIPHCFELQGTTAKGNEIVLLCTLTTKMCTHSKNSCNASPVCSLHLSDISDLKSHQNSLNAQIALKSMEAELERDTMHKVSNTISVGLWRMDERGDLVYANRAFLEMFNRSWKEMKGKLFKNYIHKEDMKRIAETPLSDEGEMEFRIILPNANIRHVRIKYTLLEDGVSSVGTMDDSTISKVMIPELMELKKSILKEKTWQN